MHMVEHAHHAARIGIGHDPVLATRGLHADRGGAGGKEPPIRNVRQGLIEREFVSSRRRLHQTVGRGGRRGCLLRRCERGEKENERVSHQGVVVQDREPITIFATSTPHSSSEPMMALYSRCFWYCAADHSVRCAGYADVKRGTSRGTRLQ